MFLLSVGVLHQRRMNGGGKLVSHRTPAWNREILNPTACELVGIRILNHVIIGDNTYFSFFNEGLIKEV